MEKNNWVRSLANDIPYLDWDSISKDKRTSWNALRHSNITFELHIILQGNCQVEIDSTRFTFEAGQAVIIRPGVFHSSMDTSDPFLRITLAFFMRSEDVLAGVLAADEPFILFEINSAIRSLCYEILKEYDHPNPVYGQEMLSVMFSQLWVLIFRSILPQKSSTPSTMITKSSDIHTIEMFFSSEREDKCTRKNLAQQLHCSERQVNRILMQLYGMNFRQKKQQTRIDYAKFLLRNTDKKISEICTLVGYADETAFYKSFKANCQMTPQEFRRSSSHPIS